MAESDKNMVAKIAPARPSAVAMMCRFCTAVATAAMSSHSGISLPVALGARRQPVGSDSVHQ